MTTKIPFATSFNTLKFSNRLTKAGFTTEQAEGLTQALNDVLLEEVLSDFVKYIEACKLLNPI